MVRLRARMQPARPTKRLVKSGERVELSEGELRGLDDYMVLWFCEDGSSFLGNYDISSLTFRMKCLLCSTGTAKPVKSIK